MQFSDSSKIGTGLIAIGLGFIFLGMILLFDSKLLAMGNIMALTGFIVLSGVRRSLEFFGLYGSNVVERWRKNWRGLITFMFGLFMIMSGWGTIGILVELYGGLKLFSSFIPLVRNLPGVDSVLQLPGINWLSSKVRAQSKGSSSMV